MKNSGGKMLKINVVNIRFTICFFLLLCLFFAKNYGDVMGKEELGYIEQGLGNYNLDFEELKFDRKWVKDDTFRLDVVTRLMDNPLDVPKFLEGEGEFCDSVDCYSISELIGRMSFFLDTPIPSYYIPEDNKRFSQEGVPDVVNRCMSILLTSFAMADEHLKRASASLTQRQMEQLLVNAPIIWSDESDSLEADSLKGILYKERNMEFDTTSLESDTLLKFIKKIDRTELLTSSMIVQRGIERVLGILNKEKFDNIGNGVVLDTSTSFGRVVIGGETANIYDGSYALIIDFGGDDHYYGRFASGISMLEQPFSIVIDLSGNDIYASESVFSIGSGLFGCGILVDMEGNDVYRGFHNSLAAGLFGTGIIVDNGGKDLYEGGYFSEGAGFVGLGILYDKGGDDMFTAFDWTQGFGSIFGYGLLLNKGGDDVYRAGGRYIHHPLLPHDYRSFAQGFGMGFRPDAGGGIGFLYDTEGNDFYNSEVFTQGGSYWYSLGMLLDRKGNDYYNACQYAQGSGIHLSLGILLDETGSDHYFSRFGPSQGEGHDLSVGFLIDKKGNDSYMVSGGQGIGLTNSCGFFIDYEGNDVYSTSEKLGQGGANRARGFGGFGIFVDMGGRDSYPKSRPGEDETVWTGGSYGIGMDVKSSREVEKEEYAQRDTLGKDASMSELFEAAALWEVAENKERVRNARERLKKRGMEAIDYIINNEMDTKSGLELRAIEEVAKAHPDSIEPHLLELVEHDKRRVRGNAIWLLGKIESRNSTTQLIAALDEKRNWSLRNTIIGALGDIGKESATEVILPYLKDEKERVRITSLRALGKIKDNRAIDEMMNSFTDRYFTVRLASENSIVSMGDSALKPLIEKLEITDDKSVTYHIISVLGRLAQTQDSVLQRHMRLGIKKVLIPYLDSKESYLRAQTVRALSMFEDTEVDDLLRDKKKYESDPFVIGVYREALK
jgi:HEAT repeat protein